MNQDKCREKKAKLQHWHKISFLLGLYDIVAVNAAYFLALWFRFDCMYSAIPQNYLRAYVSFAPTYTAICLVVFFVLRLYNSMWRFASFTEFVRVVTSSFFTGALHAVAITLLFRRMPIVYYVVGMGIQFLLVLGIRFSYRLLLAERGRRKKNNISKAKRVMLVGAGNAGQSILRDAVNMQEEQVKICCIIDDNSNKWGRYIDDVPIVGGREDILLNVEKYRIDQIFVAIPSASPENMRDILNICKESGCDDRCDTPDPVLAVSSLELVI